ncbi:hypothetical protein C5167_007682 [Papaver somniferum]|nr:hypothetical protein C5167_007682 [Papaver somniferum]
MPKDVLTVKLFFFDCLLASRIWNGLQPSSASILQYGIVKHFVLLLMQQWRFLKPRVVDRDICLFWSVAALGNME